MDTPTLLSLYRTMRIIRECEEQLARAHQKGLVHGACHTSVGQEAVATGVCAHLRPSDVVFSTHRGHGHALAKGLAPADLVAELYGRQAGCSQGRGGSMHLFKPEIGLMGTSGIVGPCILQACGGGYSFKVRHEDGVAVAFFGDGAVNNGAFHEGLNMASIWKLPVLFICENNQFATEVPFTYASGIPQVGRRAANYGIPGHEIDGNDLLAVLETAGAAVQRARSGEGPTLIECRTYRTRPHAEGMGDYTYRTREDVEAWRARCPIQRLRQQISDQVSQAQLDAIDREVAQLMRQAEEEARTSPEPDPREAARHVYCESPSPARSPLLLDPPGPGTDEEHGVREITFMQATQEALAEEMAAQDHIFVMGEGIGKRGGNFNTTTGLYDLYGPDRLCDTPICERGFVGLGGGAAMTGTRPVIDFMFADFVLDGFGEMVNQIAKMQYMSSGRLRMPILLRGCIGIGHSAATHHSGSYYATFAQYPGLHVVVPSTPFDAKGLLKRALNSDNPVLFLEHRELLTLKGPVPTGEYEIPFGRASVVQPGTDVTVVALARMVHWTRQAAAQLPDVSVEIIDPRTILPLDMDTILQSIHKTGRLLIVDESFAPCGIGAEIAAAVAEGGFDDLDAPIRRLNGLFTPTPYSPALEQAVIPHVQDITRAIQALLEE